MYKKFEKMSNVSGRIGQTWRQIDRVSSFRTTGDRFALLLKKANSRIFETRFSRSFISLKNLPALEAFLKRGMDVGLSLIGLVATAPLMIIIAVAIRISMGGDVFYPHQRVGRDGRKFMCLKFRTMVPDADKRREAYLEENPEQKKMWQENQKLAKDPAVTPIGSFLRITSLDELPQLVNVLRGDMSLVGPRPVTRKELDEKYGVHKRYYYTVRPGVTGLWQVSGRNSLSYENRVTLDCYYVRKRSLFMDLKILFKTVPALIRTGETS